MDPTAVRAGFDEALEQLTFNSKPVINMLTMLAGDYKPCAAVVVDVLCSRILDGNPKNMLPVLYVMDSIMKNIGKPYPALLHSHIVRLYLRLYEMSNTKDRGSARHVRNTWDKIFRADVLESIDRGSRSLDEARAMRRAARASATGTRSNGGPHGGPHVAIGGSPISGHSPAYYAHEEYIQAQGRPKGMSPRGGEVFPHDRGGGRGFHPPPQERYGHPIPRHHGPPMGHAVGGPDEYPRQQRPAPHVGPGGIGPRGSGGPPAPHHRHADYHSAGPRGPLPHVRRREQEGRGGGASGPLHRGNHPDAVVTRGARPPENTLMSPTSLLDTLATHGLFNAHAPASTPTIAIADPRIPPPRDVAPPTGTKTGTEGVKAKVSETGGDIPEIKLVYKDLKKQFPSVIRALYNDLPLQCTDSGVRFAANAQADLDEHKDRLFRLREERKKPVARARRWYCNANVWVKLTDARSRDEQRLSSVFNTPLVVRTRSQENLAPALSLAASKVPCSVEEKASCGICKEKLKVFYDDDEEEWCYKDTVQKNEVLFHAACWVDAERDNTVPTPLRGNSGEVARAPDEGVRIPGLAPPVKIEEHVSEGGAGEAAMETDGGGGHAADSDAHEGGTSAGAPPDAAEVDNSPRPSKKLRI